MISIFITAWKEEKTVANCIATFIDGYQGDYEIILACPDLPTHQAALDYVTEAGIADKLVYIKDEGKGKPLALGMMMDKAKGDIWFFGDGDVYFSENNISKMLKHFEDPQVMAVTGRPVSSDSRATMMGYFGHLLTDAAHHKRNVDLVDAPGYGRLFVKKRPFFPVSGYLFAMRRTDIRPPVDTLVEDAFISTTIYNRGGKIAYVPEALVYVKFPKTLSDYFKQKKRSVGGYVQLWKYGIVRPETNTRSFSRELEYFWFPLKYARNPKEFIWSLMLYPIRVWLWIRIFWERRVLKKDFAKTWVRIESTK